MHYDCFSNMKKNCRNIKTKNPVLLLFFVACSFLFCTCGLEEYYVLEAPFRTYHEPNAETEFAGRYFDFETNEAANAVHTSFDFLGTAVYYKIYNDLALLTSRASTLNADNNSTTYGTAATRLINTYGYQQLGTDSGSRSPLIEAASPPTDRRIYIRLSNYQTDSSYQSKVIVGYNGTDPSVPGTYMPRRSILKGGGHCTFDFGRTEIYDDVPSSGNEDYNHTESGSPTTFYVDLYAVSVGRDTTYTMYYSKVLHLGVVKIDAAEADN